ncbi:PTS ascorbate transporter subunit IIC [Corynebacterium poyangense]|uniref:Ascorbate-specific PTS system EIIC component n=1 Tax=Corynebacterium poyangense TaxID=2684405 RepID=A0A7H0SPB9_9CORY|nr:PTS ascorbate transporter subunit IIC [Corynebacterium poyangense]MBZ8177970.1 PTS ascorbate transporter subunit IIC [Corynebacterium poyangense]QNQ90394.1 PTS ascorbate transporter subunit IIC [Corynebacterium poyangense]
MNSILKFFVDVFSQPAVIIGLIALLGLVLQRKSFSDTMKGTIKSFVGFLVLAAGAGLVSDSLEPFGNMFSSVFGVQGVVPNNEAIVGPVLLQYGSTAALIFFFGMIVNVIFARLTNFKYIYLSGHVALYQSAMLAVILIVAGFSPWQAIIIGALAEGVITTISPAVVQPFLHRATGTNDVALGHTGGFGIAFSGWLASITKGNPEHSTETMNVPKNLSFVRDTNVVIMLSMGIIFLVVALIAGPSYVHTQISDGQNYLVWAVMQAGRFTAGVFIILAGVRAVLNEIVPAFQGISQKLVPNSKPALDVPITFTFAPNAVMIGFLSSLVAGILGMIVMGISGLTVIIPGIVAHFMTGGASGVIGNAVGGRRGAIIGAFGNGVFITLVPFLLLPVLGEIGNASSTFGDSDYGVIGLYVGWLNMGLGQLGILAGVLVAVAGVFLSSWWIGRKEAATSTTE